jgi:hypothetical protein
MYYSKHTYKLYVILLAFMLGFWEFGVVNLADAAGSKNVSRYKEYENKEISGVKLDGRGILERLEKDVCVIGDVLRPFAPFVSYYSALNKSVIYRSKFTPGSFVGYRINSKREIIELYLFGD